MEESSLGESQSTERTRLRNANFLHAMQDLMQIRGRFSPGNILLIIIGGIVLAEVIAMIFVYYIRDFSYFKQILLDTTIMTVIISPLLYLLSFKPLLLQIQQRSKSESIIKARLRLMQFATEHPLDELLQFTLDEVETLTGSSIGFFHFLESNQTRIWLQAWSTNTLQNMCRAEGKNSHYDLEQAGVWADAVRYRQPVIHNDYAALEHRKGMPPGHALVTREMVIPILRDNKVVAILGLGNKPQDFTSDDMQLVSTLADFAWDVVENKRAEIALRQSEEKFRTLAEWTYDWEMWLDPQDSIVYASPSCERITGFKPDEYITDPGLVVNTIHEEDRRLYEEHQANAHDASAGPMMVAYRIVHRDGSIHWIEHICRPLFGPENQHLGRRISNRDITLRKQAEQKIFEQNQKEQTLIQTIRTIQRDIARDLHDTLGQNISYLRMNLTHLSEAHWNDSTNINDHIQNMTKAANESYELIRALLAVLRSGDSYDPLDLFTRFGKQIAERSSFQIDLSSTGYPKPLSPHQIRQLFYIFREALSNIEKYARASQVTAEFTWEDPGLTLSLSDDGCGFSPDRIPSEGHYGVKFMHERAGLINGSFTLRSAPGQGTTITVYMPYE